MSSTSPKVLWLDLRDNVIRTNKIEEKEKSYKNGAYLLGVSLQCLSFAIVASGLKEIVIIHTSNPWALGVHHIWKWTIMKIFVIKCEPDSLFNVFNPCWIINKYYLQWIITYLSHFHVLFIFFNKIYNKNLNI